MAKPLYGRHVTACPRCGARVRGADGYLDPRTAERRFTVRPCGHGIDARQAKAIADQGYPVEVPHLDGAGLIEAERARQVGEEHRSPEHDAEHEGNELAWAAWCYLDRAASAGRADDDKPPGMWPWEAGAWKPGKSPLRLLIIAGALIAAEIDRRLARGEKP